MNLFPESPLFIVENALERLFEGRLSTDKLLGLLESQHRIVNGWLENLEQLEPTGEDDIEHLTNLGFEGNAKMLEALEWLFEAAQSEEFEEQAEQAAELLAHGHDLVEASFRACEEIEEELDTQALEVMRTQLG